MATINFKDWDDFPEIVIPNSERIFVNEVHYKGKSLKVGDMLVWINEEGNEMANFIVSKISIYPRVEVCSKELDWMFIGKCKKRIVLSSSSESPIQP